MAKKELTGLQAEKKCSLELQAVIGSKTIGRGQAVAKIWAYIKKKKLNNGVFITADKVLEPLFKKCLGKVTVFKQKEDKWKMKKGQQVMDAKGKPILLKKKGTVNKTLKPGKNQFTMYDIGSVLNNHLS